MMDFLTFTFQGFWHFLGVAILLGMVLNFILAMYNRTFRHYNIRKHGYPPLHCDADGDFKPKEQD
jgi:D-alanyl-lipoteichoic acid acyltransferase DltB (MBOAT superfamily)